MRRIQPALIDLASLYHDCVEQRQDAACRARLTAATPMVVAAGGQYDTRGSAATLYEFRADPIPAGGATDDDFVDLYETAFARKGSRGRWAYDRIRLSAPGDRCPYCGQLPVNVLDHYLPKRPNGILAIVPKNLVPCCLECNTAKADRMPTEEAGQPIHPYFDNFDDQPWLKAEVNMQNGVVLTFYVAEVPQWSAAKEARARRHFNLFSLGRLFSIEAATELVNIKYRLGKLHAHGGEDVVQNHLQEEAVAREAAAINSWQTAMYKALSQSREFCSSGFQHIDRQLETFR